MKRLFLLTITIILTVSIFLWERIENIRLRYKVTQLQNQHEKLLSGNDNLLFKINSILSSENMDSLVRIKQLSLPEETSIVILEI
jgi:hypothetical protein